MFYSIAHDFDTQTDKYLSLYKNQVHSNPLSRIIRYMDYWILDRMIEWGKKNAEIVLAQTIYQQVNFKKQFDCNPILIRNSYKTLSEQSTKTVKEDVILWVANLKDVKQPLLFLKLVDDLNYSGWKFIMIGKEHAKFSNAIKNVKNSNFKYLGQLEHEETEEWFRRSKIFINTSLGEGFPNTFIQSWYNMTLVLSLQFDPDDLLKREKIGLFFHGRYESLRNKLIRIIQYKNYNLYYNKYVERAFDFAKNEFNLNSNYKKLIEIINKNNNEA